MRISASGDDLVRYPQWGYPHPEVPKWVPYGREGERHSVLQALVFVCTPCFRCWFPLALRASGVHLRRPLVVSRFAGHSPVVRGSLGGLKYPRRFCGGLVIQTRVLLGVALIHASSRLCTLLSHARGRKCVFDSEKGVLRNMFLKSLFLGSRVGFGQASPRLG